MIDQPMTDETRMLLAAELVLGLLSEADRAEALEKLARDPELAAEVRRWEAHLAPLFAEHTSVGYQFILIIPGLW